MIEKYPKMIKEEVKRYTTAVCSFFNATQQGSQVPEMKPMVPPVIIEILLGLPKF